MGLSPNHPLFDYERPVRETFARFPVGVQPLLTFVSGKPLSREAPLFNIGPRTAITIDIIKLMMGIVLGGYCFSARGWGLVALPFCWLLCVNGARSLASDAHYAGHACVTGKPVIDIWLGDFLSTLILSSNMRDYAEGHNKIHHGRDGIKGVRDPDIDLMFMMGFKTGQPLAWYWQRLWCTLISPRYHILYAWSRIYSNFLNARGPRLLLCYGIHGAFLGVVGYYNLWGAWFYGWFIPIFPLFAMSAALQFPSEHLWLAQRDLDESPKVFLRRISHGRFFLVPAPREKLPNLLAIKAWCWWSAAMLLPLFERFFVCVSILPAHDYHHRRPKMLDWPMEPYYRQRDIDHGASDYREFYGLEAAIAAHFQIMSKLPKNENTWPVTLFDLMNVLLRCDVKTHGLV